MSSAVQFISPESQAKVESLFSDTAKAYGGQAGKMYAATPSIAQTINDKIVEHGDSFLSLLQTIPVSALSGEKVNLGLTGHITSRTDTSGSAERVAKNLLSTDGEPYTLHKTNSDAAIKYNDIDVWAKFSDFRARYASAIRQAISDDRLTIGWNGTSAAADSVAADLSDVNIGWLELIRLFNGGSQYVLGVAGSHTLGGGTYANLDVLVHDAISRLDITFRQSPDLVVLIGQNVMQYARGAYYEAQGNTPTEKQKISEAMTVETYGGLRAYVPPYFDPDSILVTSLSNLMVYYQDTSWRRQQLDNPKKDQYEDFNTRNEGYVVGHGGKASLIQGIEYA